MATVQQLADQLNVGSEQGRTAKIEVRLITTVTLGLDAGEFVTPGWLHQTLVESVWVRKAKLTDVSALRIERRGPPCLTDQQREAARREGWDVFDREGSDNGRWQVCRLDDATAYKPPGCTQLMSDSEAWSLVMHGGGEHHTVAREFIKHNNPAEWRTMCRATGYKE